MRAEELYTLRNYEVLVETAKAILIDVNGEEIWIPLSQVTNRDDEASELTMTAWIAKEKGLL